MNTTKYVLRVLSIKLRYKLYFSFSIPTPGFPHFYYMLGANLGLLLYGEVSVMISNRMLKVVAKEVSFPLEIRFNRSFRENKFPQIFKESNVIPLSKNGDNSCPSNFRPILLLSGVGRIQERIVFKNIHNYFNENNLLYKYQSGFLPNHSTTLQ